MKQKNKSVEIEKSSESLSPEMQKLIIAIAFFRINDTVESIVETIAEIFDDADQETKRNE